MIDLLTIPICWLSNIALPMFNSFSLSNTYDDSMEYPSKNGTLFLNNDNVSSNPPTWSYVTYISFVSFFDDINNLSSW